MYTEIRSLFVILEFLCAQAYKRQPRTRQPSNQVIVDAVAGVNNQEDEVDPTRIRRPPGKWRLGIPSPQAVWLFMRFATKG